VESIADAVAETAGQHQSRESIVIRTAAKVKKDRKLQSDRGENTL
jgi:hypothetical protein